MNSSKFSLLKRLKSFKYAFDGLRILIKEEHNSRVHIFIAICVIGAGIYFEISSIEWMALIFSIGFVITVEIINSAIENICDFISPEKHELIKKVKDLAAAAVLITTIVAVAIGLIIFIPKLVYVL